MTTYFSRSVTCATCGQSSDHHVLGSTNSFGSPDLDLRPPPMKRDTMGAWVQRCPHCGYCAGELAQPLPGAAEAVKEKPYLLLLGDERYPELARRFLAQAYLLADAMASGWARLHAAWVCDDADLDDLAAGCRTAAAECFERLGPSADNEEGVVRGAVLVDVLRRARQFERAARQCDALLALASAKEVVRSVLLYQKELIARQDTAGHRVADCPGLPAGD
jgi:hypothetical protein